MNASLMSAASLNTLSLNFMNHVGRDVPLVLFNVIASTPMIFLESFNAMWMICHVSYAKDAPHVQSKIPGS